EQIPDRLASFIRRDEITPVCPQEGTDYLRGEVIRHRHVDHVGLPVDEEGLGRGGMVFRGDFPFDDDTTVYYQARYGVSHVSRCSSRSSLSSAMISSIPTGRRIRWARTRAKTSWRVSEGSRNRTSTS